MSACVCCPRASCTSRPKRSAFHSQRRLRVRLGHCGDVRCTTALPPTSICDLARSHSCHKPTSLCLLDLRHRELAVDAIWHEANAVAGLDGFEHRGIARAEDHRHALVHIKFLERPVLDCDLARGLIDLRDLTAHEVIRLCDRRRRAHAEPHRQYRSKGPYY